MNSICRLVVTVVSAFPLLSSTANAEWVSRTVTEVDGRFSGIQPTFGFEVGIGTSRIEWGDPLPGSFTSSLSFQEYDRFPGLEQPWFSSGQTVMPGDTFLAGIVTFRNGSLASSSSAENLSADLNASFFGAEFLIDNHPLLVSDTWRISIVQTPNQGVDPVADADYIFFTDFPSLGSFRVFEGQSTSVEILARFGSVDPAGFGAVADPSAGVVLPSVTPVNSVPEPSSLALLISSLGCLVVRRSMRWRTDKRTRTSPE